MRLIDLDPQWIMKDGKRVGFTFLTPLGVRPGMGKQVWRQSCFAIPSPPFAEQCKLLRDVGAEGAVQTSTAGVIWSIAGGIENASFETLTVTPSIDGSAGGLWHGFITKGEAK